MGSTAFCAVATAELDTGAARAESSAQRRAPSWRRSSIVMTAVKSGRRTLRRAPGVAVASSGHMSWMAPRYVRPRKASMVTTTRGRACSSVHAISRGVENVLMATSGAPIFAAANAVISHSGRLGSRSATRSPRLTPSASSARATSSTRARSAA